MKAYYPYARDTAAIRSYQEAGLSPRDIVPVHPAVMDMMVDRHRIKVVQPGEPFSSEVNRGPIKKLDMDVQDYSTRMMFPVNPSYYKVTISNRKKPEASTSASATEDGNNGNGDNNGNKDGENVGEDNTASPSGPSSGLSAIEDPAASFKQPAPRILSSPMRQFQPMLDSSPQFLTPEKNDRSTKRKDKDRSPATTASPGDSPAGKKNNKSVRIDYNWRREADKAFRRTDKFHRFQDYQDDNASGRSSSSEHTF